MHQLGALKLHAARLKSRQRERWRAGLFALHSAERRR